MTNRFINPRPQFLDAAGKPLLLGEMGFFENGTLIRKDTFTDVNEKNKNPNPVLLNADGSLPNVFYAGTARAILTFDPGTGQQQRFDLDGVGQFGSGAAFDDFNTLTEYEDAAIVVASDDEIYRSLQNNNQGNDPLVSPTFWERLEFIRVYNENVTYGADDIAKASNGLIFRSLQAANLNNDPLTSPLFWGTPVSFVDLNILGDLSFAATELTIATGSVAAETSHHTIDTQADAASDDLDTITVAGVADFSVLYLRLENAARVVTLKDNTGNIQTKNNEDIILDVNIPTILFRVGTDWFEVQRPVVDNPFNQNLNTTDNVQFAQGTFTDVLNALSSLLASSTSNQIRIFETDAADPLDETRFNRNFDIFRIAHFDNSLASTFEFLESTLGGTTVLSAGDGVQGLLIDPITGNITFPGIVSVDDTAEAISTTSASLQTDGGIASVKQIIAGGGILLGGTAAANLINDAETGTFNPTVQDTSFSDAEGQTYSTQSGTYSKIGDLVHIEFTLVVTSLGTLTAASQAFIGNLPFVTNAINAVPLIIGRSTGLNLTAGEIPIVQAAISADRIEFRKWSGTGGAVALVISELGATPTLRISGSYKVL